MTQTRPAFIKHWRSRLDVLDDVLRGLETKGKAFQWGSWGQSNYIPMLKALGITLVTKTWLDARGYELNRGAKPVGSIYYTSPISRHCDVYVLECQAWLKDPAKLAKVEAKAKVSK